MIYTVTLNPAIDKTVEIPGFAAGKVNRVQNMRLDAGGKGINVTKCLASFGQKSIAAMILGGSNGNRLQQMLLQQGISTLAVSVSGETRTNLKIIDSTGHSNTDINEPGPLADADTLADLREKIGQSLCPGDAVILSGSLPRGAEAATYRQWCAYFQSVGARVYLDADGEALRLGIQAVPYLIKPNDEELSRLLGRPVDSLDDMLQAGHSLLAAGIREVVISLGAKGALFLNGEGACLAEALSVPVRSTVGAGDSMVAAMAYAKENALSREQQIRLAMAMGAASVMCDGTQAPERNLVWELAKQVKFQEVSQK